jgi:protein TonB
MIQSAHNAGRLPLQAALIAGLLAIAIHAWIWLAWQGMATEPLPKEIPPLVIEVALTAAPVSPPPATPAITPPTPAAPPAPAKPQPKPLEKAKPKPKPKTPAKRPVAKPLEAPKTVPKPAPQKPATPVTEPAPAVTAAPPMAAPAPAKIAAPVAEPLVGAAYKAPGLKNPPLSYPRIALSRQWEGTVTLEIQVLANGSAGEVKIVSSSGHEILDEAAIEQVKAGWHFIPAHRGDKTVDGWVRVPLSFKLQH